MSLNPEYQTTYICSKTLTDVDFYTKYEKCLIITLQPRTLNPCRAEKAKYKKSCLSQHLSGIPVMGGFWLRHVIPAGLIPWILLPKVYAD